jgi:hypothetical protein
MAVRQHLAAGSTRAGDNAHAITTATSHSRAGNKESATDRCAGSSHRIGIAAAA